jgi:hypothetical protein
MPAAQLLLRRTAGRAARLAHALAPELVAAMPALVDPRTRRLRLVPGFPSAGGGLGADDDTDDEGLRGSGNAGSSSNAGSSGGGGSGGGGSGGRSAGGLSGGVLPWLGLGAYTDVALFEGSRGGRWGSSPSAVPGRKGGGSAAQAQTAAVAAASDRMSRSESLKALQFSLGSVPAQARPRPAALDTVGGSGTWGPGGGGGEPQARSAPASEWLLQATRAADGRKVLLKGYGARKSRIPKRPSAPAGLAAAAAAAAAAEGGGGGSGDGSKPLPLSTPGGSLCSAPDGRSRLASEEDAEFGCVENEIIFCYKRPI